MPSTSGWHAVTIPEDDGSRILISLAIEDLEPLLNPDLSMEDRLKDQFIIATTIVHELAHAMNRVNEKIEAYFEDELVSEAGQSAQTAIWGCNTERVADHLQNWRDRQKYGPLALFATPWPGHDDVLPGPEGHASSRNPIRIHASDPPESKYLELWRKPIPLIWLSHIQQEDFWTRIVPVLGAACLRIPPSSRQIRYYDWNSKQYGPYQMIHEQGAQLVPTGAVSDSADLAYASFYSTEQSRRHLVNTTTMAGLDQDYQQLRHDAHNMWQTLKHVHDLGPAQLERRLYWLRSVREQERWYAADPPDFEPVFFDIMTFIVNNRVTLAIDTMTTWVPFVNFLSYLNREAVIQGAAPILENDLRQMLRHCQTAGEGGSRLYFHYAIVGWGKVRTIPNGWPEIQKYPKFDDDEPLGCTPQMYGAVKGAIHDNREEIWKDALDRRKGYADDLPFRDVNTEDIVDFVIRENGWDNHPMRRGVILNILAHLCRNHDLIGPGPRGVTRRIDSGWTGEWLCDRYLDSNPGPFSDEEDDDSDDSMFSDGDFDDDGDHTMNDVQMSGTGVAPMAPMYRRRQPRSRRKIKFGCKKRVTVPWT